MRSFLSAMVLAAFFALLVPDNRAQAVNATDAFGKARAIASQSLPAPVARERGPAQEAPIDSDAAMLLAMGFLGAVMARRLRAD